MRHRPVATLVRLLVFVLFLQTCWAANPQNSAEEGKPEASIPEQIQEMVQEAAQGLFFLAWPTATYTNLSFGFPTVFRDGIDVPVLLNGRGINRFGQSNLYLTLILSFRNYKITDVRMVDNNGAFPPFFTSELTLAAISEILDESARPHSGTNYDRSVPRNAPPAMPQIVPTNSAPVLGSPSNAVGPGIKSGADLLWALDNSLWIADGKPSTKQIYVIASPCDLYSRQLYAASRSVTSSVQIRWIEMVPAPQKECRPFLGMLARGDAGLLVQAYETGIQFSPAPADLQENALRWSTGAENALTPILRHMLNRYNAPLEYPTVLWVSSRGIEASMRPDNLSAIVVSIADRPDAVSINPMSRTLMPAQYDFKPAGKRAGAKRDGVKLYSMPDDRSQVASTLPKNFGYPIARKTKVEGETWLELQLAPDPLLPNLFVKESDVVQVK